MGSGGLRGLQILRSGACSARGGFDSHAFPPVTLGVVAVMAVAVALSGMASHASAAAAAADSVTRAAPARAFPDTTARATPTHLASSADSVVRRSTFHILNDT